MTIYGHKFDILQVGTVSLLTLAQTGLNLLALAVQAGIDRVKSHCSATYIQNISMAGKWLGEQDARLAVRVVHWVPEEEALQVRMGDDSNWHPAQYAKEKLDIVTKSSPRQIDLFLHGVTFNLRLGLNRRKDEGYNFLNLNIRGLGSLGRDVRLSGLLAGDDYTKVAQSPGDCHRRAAHNAPKSFATTKSDLQHEYDMYDGEQFLSYLQADAEP